MVGESAEKRASAESETIRVLEANLDDMNPQIYATSSKKPSPRAPSMFSPPPCK